MSPRSSSNQQALAGPQVRPSRRPAAAASSPRGRPAVIVWFAGLAGLVGLVCLAGRPVVQPALGQQMLGGADQSTGLQSGIFKDLSGPTSGKIQTLDVICGKNFMTVRAEFSAPFYGIVFSKGTYGQENCIYVKSNSGLTHAAFNVYYDQCGTKPDLQGKFYENTIVIQYGSDIIEAYDEAKRLRCEWFEAYEKPATFKPAIPVADLEVVEMNFQGDDIDCWMEIQEGSGPWSREVAKIVPVGQPMTIVVAINDYNGQFDMRVKSCMAHDGVQQPIALTDEFGCVLRPKMLTPFTKIKNPAGSKKATVLSYSRFLAFKFPDSMTVQIQCTVEVCRHGCADACQRVPSIAATTLQPELSLSARWPAAPNQPSIEGPRAASKPALEPADSQYRAGRVPFGAPPAASRPSFGSRDSRPTEDDMSSSDSNQAAVLSQAQQAPQPVAPVPVPVPAPVPSPPQPVQQTFQRRPLDHLASNGRRGAQFTGMRIPQASAGANVAPASTSTQAPVEGNKAGEANQEGAELTVPDEPLTRLSAPVEQAPRQQDSQPATEAPASSPASSSGSNGNSNGDSGESASGNSNNNNNNNNSNNNGDSVDRSDNVEGNQNNRPEASQPKATMSLPDEQPGEISAGETQSSKPSVQANDELAEAAKAESAGAGDQMVAQGSSSVAAVEPAVQSPVGSSSSLKTVELEIPANEDPVRSLANVAGSAGSFGSYADLSQQGYKQGTVNFANDASQVIQPRDSADKRDKSEDSTIEAMMTSGKSRFGARSQPQAMSNGAPVSPSEQSQSNPAPVQSGQPANHQMSAAAPHGSDTPISSDSAGSGASDTDKLMIDRSDDSSSLTEIAHSTELQHNEESRKLESPSSIVTDLASSESSSAGGPTKVQPVVGTEELVGGISQLEDRIGAPAPSESLEDALARLQQQLPRAEALVSKSDKPDSRADQQQQQTHKSAEAPKQTESNERLDLSALLSPLKQTDGQQQASQQGSNQIQAQNVAAQTAQRELSQPFPNVAGQAKVIPDPLGSVGGRGGLSAQASNSDVAQTILPASSAQFAMNGPAIQGKQPELPQQQQQQQQQQQPSQIPLGISPKPTAQITNVPVSIGFAPNQIPEIKQLTQQLAFFQQQQQQQQQQQTPRPTTAKPPRSRFNLLSPQAALQAVASRLLPKSLSQQQQQQQQPRPFGNLKPDGQHQQPHKFSLFKHQPTQAPPPTPQQQQQQQHQMQQQIQPQPQQPLQPQLQQAYLANMFNQQQLLQNQQPQPQQQQLQPPTQHQTAGVAGRLGGQQPLVRSRRSALMPNGHKGNGELGMTKTFMVVTGMDLAFLPNATETELPPILEGRRLPGTDDDVIYGVCMPIVSLTFVLTCIFWLIVFILGFCAYLLLKSRRDLAGPSKEKCGDSLNLMR